MVELLDNILVWWVWLLIGLGLVLTELMTGSWIMLGLGVAAIVVGFLVLVAPINVVWQLMIWMVLSVVFIWAFYRWFKKQRLITASGQSNLNLDIIGTVTEEIAPHRRGRVTFDTPVLGSTKWAATSTESIAEGSRVVILEINGQLIKVAHIKSI